MSLDPTARSLISDLEALLEESEANPFPAETYGAPPAVTEGLHDTDTKVGGNPGSKESPGKKLLRGMSSGKSLERKAREKRRGKVKKLGSGRNPFRHRNSNGPARAIPPVRKPRNVHKKDEWKCKCGNYSCICHNGRRRKLVRIKRAYKKVYNKSYKRWRKHQGTPSR